MRYVTRYFLNPLRSENDELLADLSRTYRQTDLLTLSSIVPTYASIITGKIGISAKFEVEYAEKLSEVLVLTYGDKELDVTEDQFNLIGKRIEELCDGPRMFLVLPLIGTLEVGSRTLTPFWVRSVFVLVQQDLGMFLIQEGIACFTGNYLDSDGIEKVNEDLLGKLLPLYDHGVVPSTPELAKTWELQPYPQNLYQVRWKDGRLGVDSVRFMLQRLVGQKEVRVYCPYPDDKTAVRIIKRIKNYYGITPSFDGDYLYIELSTLRQTYQFLDLVESA